MYILERHRLHDSLILVAFDILLTLSKHVFNYNLHIFDRYIFFSCACYIMYSCTWIFLFWVVCMCYAIYTIFSAVYVVETYVYMHFAWYVMTTFLTVVQFWTNPGPIKVKADVFLTLKIISFSSSPPFYISLGMLWAHYV